MYDYWESNEFGEHTKQLQELFDAILRGRHDGKKSETSFSTLGDKQRESKIGCIYLAGSRIDNAFCVGSTNVGLLHSALPTDYPKAIRPAFHERHDELIVCTHGRVVIQQTASISDGGVTDHVLDPGEHVLIRRGSPHKVSLAPMTQQGTRQIPVTNLAAGFLALKMGELGTKSEQEDMTKWNQSHPLVTIWGDEMNFLRHVAATQDVATRYWIHAERLNHVLGR